MAKRRKDRRKGRRWSYTAGSYPYSVRVYERTRGAVIYASAWDTEARGGRGGELKRSLGHRDREAAQAYADAEAAKLRRGLDTVRSARPTASRVLRLYRAHRSPDKSVQQQREDDREVALWLRVLGVDFDLSRLSRREWDSFARRRRSGQIDARGRLVTDPAKRRPVGERVVEKDLGFLRAVCRWACDFRDESGRLLMERDPSRGFHIPQERNPKRPCATHDRVDAIRKVHRKVLMRFERGASREAVESYLPEIFEIVVGTGRRISAVCSLRSENLELDPTPSTPWGAIEWNEDTDKMGKRWRCPISAQVREALVSAIRKRRSIGHVGPGWLFPSPLDPRKPVRYEQASSWLRQAEHLAGLKHLERGGWHMYRRLWASSRKGLPDVDVAQAGGWASLDALKSAYQQPDDQTMLEVVTHKAELREVR